MSLSGVVVPADFQTPLVRPKLDDREPGGFAAYSESMHLYDLAVARRFAYAQRGRYMCDDEDDVVVDVGGAGEPFVYPQLSDVARLLDPEMEVEEDEAADVVSVYEGEYEVDSDYEFEEENPMKKMTYTLKKITHKEFHKSMEQECPLCLEELKREVCVTTNCKHSFCVTCYDKYTKRSCPCCRQYVDTLTTYCL
jgi:hypothetical protein